jgi:hypothetical protein
MLTYEFVTYPTHVYKINGELIKGAKTVAWEPFDDVESALNDFDNYKNHISTCVTNQMVGLSSTPASHFVPLGYVDENGCFHNICITCKKILNIDDVCMLEPCGHKYFCDDCVQKETILCPLCDTKYFSSYDLFDYSDLQNHITYPIVTRD